LGSATAITHVWKDNKVIARLKAHTNNITLVEAELMVICIGLTHALESSDIHQILIITDALEVGKKIITLDDQYLQKSIIPIAKKMQRFLEKNGRNSIHFWYCPSKLKWPRHALVDEEAKSCYTLPTFLDKNSFLLSKKKKCNSLLESWQKSFKDSKKKGQLLLEFEDNNEQVIKPTYAKGGSWLPHIRVSNSVCTRFMHMMLGHAPIEEYRQRFFPNMAIHCPCGEADVETREHIFMQCRQNEIALRLRDIRISSFVEFIIGNPTAFCFDNG